MVKRTGNVNEVSVTLIVTADTNDVSKARQTQTNVSSAIIELNKQQ